MAKAGYKLICPQSYLDARLTELSGEQAEARVAVLRRFLILFAGGLVLFYVVMWPIAAGLESKAYEKWKKHGGGGSARWGGVLAFRKYGWDRIKSKSNKAPIFFGRTFHKYDPWPFCRDIGVDDQPAATWRRPRRCSRRAWGYSKTSGPRLRWNSSMDCWKDCDNLTETLLGILFQNLHYRSGRLQMSTMTR